MSNLTCPHIRHKIMWGIDTWVFISAFFSAIFCFYFQTSLGWIFCASAVHMGGGKEFASMNNPSYKNVNTYDIVFSFFVCRHMGKQE